MAKQPDAPRDDELLAGAIPIEEAAEEEPVLDLVPAADGAGAPTAPPRRPAAAEAAPPAVDLAEADESAPKEIRTFESRRHAEEGRWQRSPNASATGAIRVKTFTSKLRLDALEHLDLQINEWLDSHPEYDVKLVTTTIGPLAGKTTEPALFVNVWV